MLLRLVARSVETRAQYFNGHRKVNKLFFSTPCETSLLTITQ